MRVCVRVLCVHPPGLSASLGIADYACSQLQAAGLLHPRTMPAAIAGSTAYTTLGSAEQDHQCVTHPISKLGLRSKL